MDGYHISRKRLKPEQIKLLQKLRTQLTGAELEIMNSIFKDFAP